MRGDHFYVRFMRWRKGNGTEPGCLRDSTGRPAHGAGHPVGRFVREGTIKDYAEAARCGRVTRARMTQIMKLLDLAPAIQEMILFLPPNSHLNERNLRPVVAE